MSKREEISALLDEYRALGVAAQIDYEKFYLYSLITHSTAIEGSTVTEIENQLMFDEGISAKGRTMTEQLMNLDLKNAYEQAFLLAKQHQAITIDSLKSLSALILKNTGAVYNTIGGTFDSSKGDLRLVNVTAGAGGRSYLNYQKVPAYLQDFCEWLNARRNQLSEGTCAYDCYSLSFEVHLRLVTIHPWADGNGRMSRLLMNMLQMEHGLMPTKVLKEEKADYIQALVDSREQESPEPFISFMFDSFARYLKSEIEIYRKSIAAEIFTEDNPGGQKTGSPVDRKHTSGGQKTRDTIMSIMEEDGKISTQAIAQTLGINRSAVSKHIKILQDSGLVRHEGPAKGGQWIVENKKR